MIDPTVQQTNDDAALEAAYRALPAHVAALTDAINALVARNVELERRQAASDQKLTKVLEELSEAQKGFNKLRATILGQPQQPAAPVAAAPVVPAPPAQPVQVAAPAVVVVPAAPPPAPADPVVVVVPPAAPAAGSLWERTQAAFRSANQGKDGS